MKILSIFSIFVISIISLSNMAHAADFQVIKAPRGLKKQTSVLIVKSKEFDACSEVGAYSSCPGSEFVCAPISRAYPNVKELRCLKAGLAKSIKAVMENPDDPSEVELEAIKKVKGITAAKCGGDGDCMNGLKCLSPLGNWPKACISEKYLNEEVAYIGNQAENVVANRSCSSLPYYYQKGEFAKGKWDKCPYGEPFDFMETVLMGNQSKPLLHFEFTCATALHAKVENKYKEDSFSSPEMYVAACIFPKFSYDMSSLTLTYIEGSSCDIYGDVYNVEDEGLIGIDAYKAGDEPIYTFSGSKCMDFVTPVGTINWLVDEPATGGQVFPYWFYWSK